MLQVRGDQLVTERGRVFTPTERMMAKMVEGIMKSLEDAATMSAALGDDDMRTGLLVEAKWLLHDAAHPA